MDDPTPIEREAAQLEALFRWLRLWNVPAWQPPRTGKRPSGPSLRTYDPAGNLIAEAGVPCAPRRTTQYEDRPAIPFQHQGFTGPRGPRR